MQLSVSSMLLVPIHSASGKKSKTAVFCAADPRISRTYVIVLQCLAVIVPATLEWFGVGPATHEFLPDGSLRIISAGLVLPRVPTLVLLMSSSLFTIISGGVFLGRFSEAMRAANAKRLTQRWQIEQLLPREARLSRIGSGHLALLAERGRSASAK